MGVNFYHDCGNKLATNYANYSKANSGTDAYIT